MLPTSTHPSRSLSCRRGAAVGAPRGGRGAGPDGLLRGGELCLPSLRAPCAPGRSDACAGRACPFPAAAPQRCSAAWWRRAGSVSCTQATLAPGRNCFAGLRSGVARAPRRPAARFALGLLWAPRNERRRDPRSRASPSPAPSRATNSAAPALLQAPAGRGFATKPAAAADKKKVQPLSFGIVTRVKDGVAFARDLGFASFGELVIFVPSPARLKAMQKDASSVNYVGACAGGGWAAGELARPRTLPVRVRRWRGAHARTPLSLASATTSRRRHDRGSGARPDVRRDSG
jgi:hypothetical protein